MVDLELLKKRGITKESLRRFFSASTPSKEAKKLSELLSNRLRDGLSRNWQQTRVWASIDAAYDAPLDQTKWNFIQNLSQKKLDATALTKEIVDYGLSSVLKPYCPDCKSSTCNTGCACSNKGVTLDLPAFYDVVVGLVPAYLKMRWAKLFNDRDLIPHYSYSPLKLTLKRKLQCEILTDLVQLKATQFDYRSDRRQIIYQTLLYGFCLQVVLEEWYKEEQVILEDGKEKDFIVKEGLRHCLPHPSKTFFDESFRLSTLNSDTGCAYFGYWHVTRWGDINRNKSYFNTDKVKYLSTDWIKQLQWYSQVYPCAAKWPDSSISLSNDRETQRSFYGQRGIDQDEDLSVVICNQFAKLVPKEWGLGDYEHPVWFRFVMASDDTVIYAAPLPYTPGSFYGYDFDGNRSRNASMATEIAPFQTIISNYFSQLLFSVEQNLTRLVFYNRDIVDEKTIEGLKSYGARLFKGLNFVDYSGKERVWEMNSIKEAFSTPTFPLHNTAEIINSIQMALNILERVLQFSAQELGAAASHQQSAAEQRIIAQSMSNRLQFSGSFIDDGEHSDKRRQYEAIMAYGDDEVFAQVAELNDVTRKTLKEMGWEVEEEPIAGKSKAGIRGSKKVLNLEGFAATREGSNRLDNPAIASSLLQMTQYLLSNPLIVQSIGIPQVVDWFNAIFTWAGLPKDYRIMVDPNNTPENQAKEAQAQMAEVANQVVGQAVGGMAEALGEKVIKPMQEALVALAQRQQESDTKDGVQDQAIVEIVQTIKNLMMPPPPPPPQPILQMPVPVSAPPQEMMPVLT